MARFLDPLRSEYSGTRAGTPMPELENPEVFCTVLESLQTGVYFVDADTKILSGNDGAETITGYLRREVVGGFCEDNSRLCSRRTKKHPK